MTNPLAGLTAQQRANASAIVAEVQREGLPLQAAQIAITTAIVESGLLSQANSNVPSSLSQPHDKVGNDGTSVGLFQQQNSWGTVTQRLNPQSATALFLARLPSGWQAQDPGAVAQKIQVSAYPDRYDAQYANGSAVASALWGGPAGISTVALTTGTNTTSKPAGQYPASGQWQSQKGVRIGDAPNINSTPPGSGQYLNVLSPLAAGGHAFTDDQYTAMQTFSNSYFDGANTAWRTNYTAPYTAKQGIDLVLKFDMALADVYENTQYDPGAAVGGIGPIPNPLAGLEAIFAWLTNKNNWLRIGLGVMGSIILFIAALLWFRGTDTGQSLPKVIPV